jgi:hypothetical protein
VDAKKAGEKALTSKATGSQIRMLMAKMKPAEREMFQESYADALAQKMERFGDNRDVTIGLYNSPAERDKAEAIFGREGANKLEAFVNRERIYDFVREAVQGNSTTVRQMIEAGLMGGTAQSLLSGEFDPKHFGEAF